MHGRPLGEDESQNHVLPRALDPVVAGAYLIHALVVMDFLNEPAVSKAFTNARNRVEEMFNTLE